MAKKANHTRSTTDNDKMLGEKIRQARLKEGMSQQQLGKALGVTFQQIQKYEKGMNRVSGARWMTMAQALNVPMSYFFEDSAVKRSANSLKIDKFMSTRQGIQIIEAMIPLSPKQQQIVIDLARSLAP